MYRLHGRPPYVIRCFMKRKLLTLSALFCSAFIVMFILVRGAEPDRIFTSASRHYDIFQLHPLDTIAFPGRVSIMRAAQGNVYGYVYSKTAIFRFNTHTHMLDTFFSNSQLSLPIITRMEIDTAAGKFFAGMGGVCVHRASQQVRTR